MLLEIVRLRIKYRPNDWRQLPKLIITPECYEMWDKWPGISDDGNHYKETDSTNDWDAFQNYLIERTPFDEVFFEEYLFVAPTYQDALDMPQPGLPIKEANAQFSYEWGLQSWNDLCDKIIRKIPFTYNEWERWKDLQRWKLEERAKRNESRLLKKLAREEDKVKENAK